MNKVKLTGPGVAILAIVGFFLNTPFGSAQQLDSETETKVLRGFQIAPVPLNMVGRDALLVGLGSYLVNVTGDCNGCHSAGTQTEFAVGGSPYFGQAERTNPATYLGGGRDFGAFPDPAGPFPHIISRNLTPDKTGLAEGGHTLAEFIKIMTTGVDMDHLHPTCTAAPDGKCIPHPFNGDLLQIMPWPAYKSMTDRDLQAIYEYLSAIPCLEGGPGEPKDRCGTAVQTTASASPKNSTVSARQITLDGTKSVSADGGALSYQWTVAPGGQPAAILSASSANPEVQLGPARGIYMFQLTVTDSTGKTSTDVATVDFEGN